MQEQSENLPCVWNLVHASDVRPRNQELPPIKTRHYTQLYCFRYYYCLFGVLRSHGASRIVRLRLLGQRPILYDPLRSQEELPHQQPRRSTQLYCHSSCLVFGLLRSLGASSYDCMYVGTSAWPASYCNNKPTYLRFYPLLSFTMNSVRYN